MSAQLWADVDGIRIDTDPHDVATLDVVINGQHVWSLTPQRDLIAQDDGWVAKWPASLRSRLNGTGRVKLKDHATSRLFAVGEIAVGTRKARIRVRNAAGQPLIVDKWGDLIVPLDQGATDVVDDLLNQTGDLLDVLNNDCGVSSYIGYGTLLGAVRSQKLIGYDNDVDLVYVSKHSCPVDIIREAYRIQRILTDAGWTVRRGSGVRMNVRITTSDGTARFIDIFTAFWLDGVFHTAVDIAADVPPEAITPLGTATLHGHQFPAPARPDAVLEAAYGPGWLVPDPAFKYASPRWLVRRFTGYFGGLVSHRKWWDKVNNAQAKELANRPTTFAQWVAATYPSDNLLVDVGSGTGRDARFFAGLGRRVHALDYSLAANRKLGRRTDPDKRPEDYLRVNLYDARAALVAGAVLARDPDPVDIYARFTLHSLEDRGIEMFFRMVSMATRRSGRLFVEFRVQPDSGVRQWMGRRLRVARSRLAPRSTSPSEQSTGPDSAGPHFRNFLAPQAVRDQIEAIGGRILHYEVSLGLAPGEDEDDYLCRIVAQWPEQSAAAQP